MELGRIFERLPHEAGRPLRRSLMEMSRVLRHLVDLFEAGSFIAAREGTRELHANTENWRDIGAVEAGSLYDPAVLQTAIGTR